MRMVVKKMISGFLALGILFSSLTAFQIAQAADSNFTKTVTVNVAQNKSFEIKLNDGGSATGFKYLLDGVNSGDRSNPGNDTTHEFKNAYAIVDLGRKYNIKNIKMSNCNGGGGAVYVGNKSDGSDKKSVGNIGWNIFDVSLNDTAAYRYVTVYANANGADFYELYVYADQTMTEVSRNRPASASDTHPDGGLTPDKAVNGTNANASDCWLAPYDGTYPWWQVEFEKELPIEYIEIQSRNGSSDPSARSNFSLYGATADITKTTNSSTLDGATQIPIGSSSVAEYNASNIDGTTWKLGMKGTDKYKYIIYKKTINHPGEIGEFRAYVVNPTVIDCAVSGNMLNVEFSDEMDANTLSEIKLIDKSGKAYELNTSYSDTDKYKCCIDISTLVKNQAYTLDVSGVKNERGINAAGNVELNSLFTFGIIGDINLTDSNGDAVTDTYFRGASLNAKVNVSNSDNKSHSAMLAIAQFDYDRFVDVQMQTATINAGKSDEINTIFTLTGEPDLFREFRVFLWDITDGINMPMCTSEIYKQAQVQDLYVATDGDDNNAGTEESPLATIEGARDRIRIVNEDMDSDINVYIGAGTYQLSDTLSFTDDDSGKNGYRVNYIADGDVTLSGGEEVTGWVYLGDGLYKAAYNGESLVHELYVDGVKATRAQTSTTIVPSGFYTLNGQIVDSTSSVADGDSIVGVVVNDAKYVDYANKSDMQLHYARGWKSFIANVVNVVEVSGKSAFILGNEFKKMISGTGHKVLSSSKFHIENAKELLDENGEFYYNKSEKSIYYKADNAPTNAYAPVLEQLINIEGKNLANKARNITFNGIRFAHCAWNYPVTNGFVGGQAQTFSGADKETALDVLGKTMVDAGIQIKKAENIEFINNEITGIAKVGIGLYNGSSNNRIEGNTFYSLGDSAVTVGMPSDNYMENEYTGYNLAFNKVCTANNVNGNFAPYNAVDGNSESVWDTSNCVGGASNTWWQVDLGDTYEIDRIDIDARRNVDDSTARRLFKVLASNDADFADGGTEIARAEYPEFPQGGTWQAAVSDTNKYRYVRIQKTNNEYFLLADVRVINESMGDIKQKEVCTNNDIYNNCITTIGELNYGAPGIQTYYTEDVDIAHNYIYNVPYTGIGMGWGWGVYTDSTTSKNNKIRDNVIDNFTTIMMDGGGIYTLGQQPGSVISGNYIKNQNNVWGAIYSDQGSKQYSVTNNVMENVMHWLFINLGVSDITFGTNYSTNSEKENRIDTIDTGSLITFVPGSMPSDAKTIADNAGLQPSYKDITSKIKVRTRILTNAEKFDNVLGEISGSMTDKQFVDAYLNDMITQAKYIYNNADSSYNSDLKAALKTAIDDADRICTKLNLEITFGGGNVTTKIIDRTEVVKQRDSLDAAVNAFVNSKNTQ